MLLILRLSRDARHHRACEKILACITVWAVAAILMITLQCDLVSPWITINAQCSNLVREVPNDGRAIADMAVVSSMDSHQRLRHLYRSTPSRNAAISHRCLANACITQSIGSSSIRSPLIVCEISILFFNVISLMLRPGSLSPLVFVYPISAPCSLLRNLS